MKILCMFEVIRKADRGTTYWWWFPRTLPFKDPVPQIAIVMRDACIKLGLR